MKSDGNQGRREFLDGRDSGEELYHRSRRLTASNAASLRGSESLRSGDDPVYPSRRWHRRYCFRWTAFIERRFRTTPLHECVAANSGSREAEPVDRAVLIRDHQRAAGDEERRYRDPTASADLVLRCQLLRIHDVDLALSIAREQGAAQDGR